VRYRADEFLLQGVLRPTDAEEAGPTAGPAWGHGGPAQQDGPAKQLRQAVPRSRLQGRRRQMYEIHRLDAVPGGGPGLPFSLRSGLLEGTVRTERWPQSSTGAGAHSPRGAEWDPDGAKHWGHRDSSSLRARVILQD